MTFNNDQLSQILYKYVLALFIQNEFAKLKELTCHKKIVSKVLLSNFKLFLKDIFHASGKPLIQNDVKLNFVWCHKVNDATMKNIKCYYHIFELDSLS